jgi:RNA polymerase sigma-70 factor, ECF subfamily
MVFTNSSAAVKGPASPGRELDEITLRRAQKGDPAAFRELVTKYQAAVHGLLSRLLGPAGRRPLVPDLAQESFIRVFKGLSAFDPLGPGRLSTWILTIATRVALDELRTRVPSPETMQAMAHAGASEHPRDPHETAAGAEVTRRIQMAVMTLSAEAQAVFLLRAHYEFEYHEIAEALGVEIGTVRSRLSRAREALRQALDVLKEEGP